MLKLECSETRRRQQLKLSFSQQEQQKIIPKTISRLNFFLSRHISKKLNGFFSHSVFLFFLSFSMFIHPN
jgi:hypothetical protein